MCWRHAPEDYGAIHFHDDDLGDCGWQTSFTFDVPADLRSGAYALHLTCDGGEDWLPLYVLPPRGTATAPVAFLASTFTYQAYANHARGNADAAYRARVAAWGAYPHNADDYPDLRALHLQQAPGRQRHRVLLAAAADPDHAAGLPDLQRRARVGAAALPGGYAPPRLAGGQGHRLRRHHRRGPARRRCGAARPLSRGDDRLASRIPHAGRRSMRCCLHARARPARCISAATASTGASR